MRRIILSSIPNDFNPDKDIILGPWCFIGREHVYPDWENLMFEPDSFRSIKEMSYNARITTEFAENYLFKLSKYLNEINNTEYSIKFWRLMVLPWLLTLVQTTWERQIRINHLLSKFSDEAVEIELIKNDIIWDFEDTLDHQQRGLLSDIYNHWLFSRLIELQIPPKWKIKWIEKTSYSKKPLNRKKILKQYLSEWYLNKFLTATVYGFGKIDVLFFELLIKLKSLFISDLSVQSVERSQQAELHWNLDWEALVKATLPLSFKKIKSSPSKNYKKRIFLTGPILWYSEKIKLKLAKAIENGSKLIVSQHGGSYGTCKVYPFPPAIEYNHFKFYSWGWQKQENYQGNIIPLPSPLLSKYSYRKKNDKVILVSTRAMLHSYRISSIPQPLQQIECRLSRKHFIENINKDIYEELYYRPALNEMGSLSDKDYFKTNFPDLKILSGPLHKETMKCKLLVVDHPDTTLNIALAANIPTICFWNPEFWDMSLQAEPYFKTLRDAGILFNNAEDAAKKINEIWNDIEGWWRQPSVQGARKEWSWQYARTNKRWRREWIKEIWKS